MNSNGFSDWLSGAVIGERLVYYSGNLSKASEAKDTHELRLVRFLAMEAAYSGKVYLFQKSKGRTQTSLGMAGDYDYIAVRADVPSAARPTRPESERQSRKKLAA